MSSWIELMVTHENTIKRLKRELEDANQKNRFVEVHGYHAYVMADGTISSMTTNKVGGMLAPKELREQAEFLLVLAHTIDTILQQQKVGA